MKTEGKNEGISRRDFIGVAGKIAALWGLSATFIPNLEAALTAVASGKAPVLWLQGMNCSGCSVSLLNSYPTTPISLLTKSISLKFHDTLSTTQGQQAVDVVNTTIKNGNYILIVEGAVPAGMPEACHVGGELFTAQLLRAATAADKIIAVGTCACYGGIPASPGNQTGAVDVLTYLTRNGISKPFIRIPGCPPHPDWMIGTITYLLAKGMPPLDADKRPTQFFAKTVHSTCRYREEDDDGPNFLGFKAGCMRELGCRGPRSHADCTVRRWNSGINDCLLSGGMCVGCTEVTFARDGESFFPTHGVGEGDGGGDD